MDCPTLREICKFGVETYILPWSFKYPEYHMVDILEWLKHALEEDSNRILTTPDRLEPKFVEELEVRYGSLIFLLRQYSECYGVDREDLEMLEEINKAHFDLVTSYYQQ
jgi:hypothetical protein